MAIETVKQRAALAPRREPYWHTVSTGWHVGYRKTNDGGHWIARAYDSGTRARNYQALSECSRLPANEQFSAAVKAAGEWFRHLDRGGTSEVVTVADAARHYIGDLLKKKGKAAADEARSRLTRFVIDRPIGSIPVRKLTRRHVEEWREHLKAAPVVLPRRGKYCRSKKPQPEAKARAASTVNRDMVALRAALNLAKENEFVTTDMAWSVALKPIEKANGRRTLYLDRDQRRALLAATPGELSSFVHALCLLPIRPGALASLRVGDFDSRAGTLIVKRDKAGEGRWIPLPPIAAELLREQARGKTPAAFLFTQWNGNQWNKDAWKRPIKTAVVAAKLPAGVTAYTLRHSTITDLVTGGLDLFTVATLAGTSILMIEQNYGHLQQDRARDALAVLSL